MTDEITKRLDQLKQAYESGILDWDTYQTVLAGFDIQPITSVEASGEHSVAVGKDIRESTVISGNNNVIQIVHQYAHEFLCSVDSHFSSELDNGQLSDKFTDQCRKAGVEFSERAQVLIEVDQKKWMIIDDSNRYIVQIENQRLNLFLVNQDLGGQQQLSHQIAEYLTWVHDRFSTIELRGIHRG